MQEIEKITHSQFREMLLDVDIPDIELAKYLRIDPEEDSPLSPKLVVNPDIVEMTEEEAFQESAMGIGNNVARWRRQLRFKKCRKKYPERPVLVTEGDSWFQFPILIKEVVDHLFDDYNVYCVSAAGDTAENMVYGPQKKKKNEYMDALLKQKDSVQAFLFSGAGNDVIGEDKDGNPVLAKVLKHYQAGKPAADHINFPALDGIIAFLKGAYFKVIDTVHGNSHFRQLPILIQGYDYAIPGDKTDPRDPIYAKPDQWLGAPLADKGIHDKQLQKDILRILIDRVYDMMEEVASARSHVHIVDSRGTLPDISDWNDEIHGTSDGFAKITKNFRATLLGLGIA